MAAIHDKWDIMADLYRNKEFGELQEYIIKNVDLSFCITEELVQKVIKGNSSKATIPFGKFKNEETILAIVTIAHTLHLENIPHKWMDATGIVSYNTHIFRDYLVPRYKDFINDAYPIYKEFEHKLSQYGATIEKSYIDTAYWTIDCKFSSEPIIHTMFRVDELTKENLKKISDRCATLSDAVKTYNNYLLEVDLFLQKAKTILGDEYRIKEGNTKGTKWLERITDTNIKREFKITHKVWYVANCVDRLSLSDIEFSVVLYNRGDKIVIFNKAYNIESLDKERPDFDMIYETIKKTVDSGYKSIELLDY